MLFELETRELPHTLEVEYEYVRGYRGSYYEPPEPEHCELISVTLHGHEVLDLMTEYEQEKIMEACMEEVMEIVADKIIDSMDY